MKNINADILIDCYSCANSQVGHDRITGIPSLVCAITLERAGGKCGEFIYEPGTDAGVRNEP